MRAKRHITERATDGTIKSYTYLVNGDIVPEGSKYCPACEEIKDLSAFSSAGNACRICANKRAAKHRAERRKDPAYVDEFNRKQRELLQEAKAKAVEEMGGCCQDCGGVFHQSVYDFHHLDPSTKDANPSKLLKSKKGREELKKCILLCANCHRLRHFKEDN